MEFQRQEDKRRQEAWADVMRTEHKIPLVSHTLYHVADFGHYNSQTALAFWEYRWRNYKRGEFYPTEMIKLSKMIHVQEMAKWVGCKFYMAHQWKDGEWMVADLTKIQPDQVRIQCRGRNGDTARWKGDELEPQLLVPLQFFKQFNKEDYECQISNAMCLPF
jgi:hypothetical protein